MKRYLILLFVIPAALHVSGQKLNIRDLVAWYRLDISRIGNEAAKKNFSFVRKSADGIADMNSFTYFWAYNFKENEKDAPAWFTVSTYEGEKSKLVYETTVKENFVSFVQGLKQAGFRFIENIKHADQHELSSYYDNNEFLVIIQPREDRWTIYFRKK